MLPVWIGYDRREDLAYKVCRHSIESKTLGIDAPVLPLIQDALRASNTYLRPTDALASTDFSLTRFLVPYLQHFEGWALFCDCDFVFTKSLGYLHDLKDDKYAVMVVKHDYTPAETVKMDDKIQHQYPRKNWSSLMLFNCAHPANQELTRELVDKADAGFLHRLGWLTDDQIGDLPKEWNHLVDVYPKVDSPMPPAGLHYTLGGPWFKDHENCDYADVWKNELKRTMGWK